MLFIPLNACEGRFSVLIRIDNDVADCGILPTESAIYRCHRIIICPNRRL